MDIRNIILEKEIERLKQEYESMLAAKNDEIEALKANVADDSMKLRMKLVMTGDGAVGKTCMVMCWLQRMFPVEYIPTVFDNFTKKVTIDDFSVALDVLDVAGPEDYDRLRHASYPNTDVFLINFSCCSIQSFRNVELKWIPEIQQHCPGVPIVLVSTKADLRRCKETAAKLNAEGLDYVDLDEAREVIKRHKDVVAVVENSALTQLGLKNTFDTAIRHALVEKFPFASWVPFKVGDWVYAYNKGKRNIAIVRQIDKSYVKVYYFKRPYWFNNQTIKQRDQIENILPQELLVRIFDDFRPFGFEILTTVSDHIGEYLPIDGYYWTPLKIT